MVSGKDSTCLEQWIMDTETDKRLLPSRYWYSDNSRRLNHCRRAVRIAMENRLTPAQKRRLEQHFMDGLSKSEIARMESSSCSTVVKSLRSAQEAIREYAQTYMEIYDTLERELRQEMDM